MACQIPLVLILPLLFLSCAGIPHEITDSRDLDEPLGLCHAGTGGIEQKVLLEDLGVSWVRLDLSWSRMQAQPGEFDFSAYDEMFDSTDAAGVRVLGILSYDTPWIHDNPEGKRQVDTEDLPAWLEFVEAVALRYGSRIGAFEVWNEPNSNRFWTGEDEDFFYLTGETVALLKLTTPDIPVVVGSIIYNPVLGSTGYLKRFMDYGAADGSDAVSLHPYGISPISAAKRLYKAREILDQNDYPGELWVTEIGYPTGGNYPQAVDEEKQGAFAAKAISSFIAAGVDRLIWYQLYDAYPPDEAPPGTSSEAFFGIAYPDDTLKSGGETMRRLGLMLQEASWAPELLKEKPPANIPAAIYPFRKSDGGVAVVVWSRIGRPALVLEGFYGDIEIYETGTSEDVVVDSGTLIQLGPEPLIISGRIDGPISFRIQ